MTTAKRGNGSANRPGPETPSLPLTTGDAGLPTDSPQVPDGRKPGEPAVTQVRAIPRPLPGRKLYQDEVYGTKELSPLAVALIDTPEFQRLAYIYQLGFTYTAFRGATHRHFDHFGGVHLFSCMHA